MFQLFLNKVLKVGEGKEIQGNTGSTFDISSSDSQEFP